MTRRIRKRQPDFPPLSSPTPSVSIILVSYNTNGQFIENCLASLRRLTYPDYEIIIVDNNSTGETRDALERCCRGEGHGGTPREKLILNKQNRGFSGGCNDGIARASGEILVFLNLDTEVDPSWLTELIRPMARDPRVAVTGCKMYFPGRRTIQHAGGIIYGNGMTKHIGYRRLDEGQYDNECEVDYVTGAGLAARREFLELCGGGFDEDYFPAYCEDVDLCYRARAMGYRVVYAPRSVLVHHESPLFGIESPIFQRLCYRGRVLFCLKNFRLRDWLFGFIPCEIRWLCAPASKGFRKKQIRAYLDALGFLLGRRYTPDHPFPDRG